MNKEELIRYARAGNAVQRYHTMNLVVGETVGHHSANVAMLCLILAGDDCTKELLAAALTHDLVEQYTGDIPAPAKWASVALAQALMDIEDEKDPFQHDLCPEDCRLLKIADTLDLCFKTLEEVRMGNTNAKRILLRGIAHLKKQNLPFEVVCIITEMEHECE